MALGEEGGGSAGIPATMLVSPTGVNNSAMPYPYPVFGGMGGGQGMGGLGDGWGILLLVIIIAALGGNWGGNNGGGGGWNSQPIVVNEGGGYGSIQRGFDQAAIMAALSGIQTGICSGFGDLQYAICNSFAQAEVADNARQIANMQQNFALQSQFADCCCKNQLATESLRATVLSENCADRFEAANNTRDIIDSQNRGFQSILDKLCSLELDNYKRENDNLRSQLNMATLAASQTAQTAQITDNIYNRLSTCPVGTVPVYGETPIFRCNNNNGCGCGCGNNGF